MARKIVAGNWKMNMLADDGQQLIQEIVKGAAEVDCELIVCPAAPFLQSFSMLKGNVKIGAQNVSAFDNGAYTGEWSAAMLKSIAVNYAIVGHSERRSLFGETDDQVNAKVHKLLADGIKPIVCCGETLEQREEKLEKEVVKLQLVKALDGLTEESLENIVVAYEPVWAIGTGVTASAEQAQEMHAFIRSTLVKLFGDRATEIPLLYGGSCKPANAKELFACEDIDGGLIGGASLKSESFLAIAQSF
ncbi:triose-phosphate isomerase [Parvicella tangerina]|uniref:Triosephosphate isomerase n=1 Tax=Parvicella tangerina TaxID=2829795 RepID=A0A916JPM2_9FLAO|nr:triose-phosphate isomerase [Parvicella tangerina]CAG5084459.1 Triosephosphate isomerase [Parvicella tangerina]